MKLTNQNILSIRLPSHFFYQSCMTKGQTNILLTYLLKKRKKKTDFMSHRMHPSNDLSLGELFLLERKPDKDGTGNVIFWKSISEQDLFTLKDTSSRKRLAKWRNALCRFSNVLYVCLFARSFLIYELKENDRETGQKVKFKRKENIEDKEWKKEGSNRFIGGSVDYCTVM